MPIKEKKIWQHARIVKEIAKATALAVARTLVAEVVKIVVEAVAAMDAA
jgi:hypothetical protein